MAQNLREKMKQDVLLLANASLPLLATEPSESWALRLSRESLFYVYRIYLLVVWFQARLPESNLAESITKKSLELYQKTGSRLWNPVETSTLGSLPMPDQTIRAICDHAASEPREGFLDTLGWAYQGLLAYQGKLDYQSFPARIDFGSWGKERQQSASFFTPPSFVGAVVYHTLANFVRGKTSEQLWNSRILEPAMGGGAFLIAAVNQLARKYLEKRYDEQGLPLPTKIAAAEWNKITSHFVAGCFGVDIHFVPVELGRLHLASIANNQAHCPHLRTGNSLLGASRLIFSREGNCKHLALGPGWEQLPIGGVYHFLLPYPEMNFSYPPVGKRVAKAEVSLLKQKRKAFTEELSQIEWEQLAHLSELIEELWVEGKGFDKLKLIMDYWCALWFWPLKHGELYPERCEFISDIQDILADKLVPTTPRLQVVCGLANELGFFHWQLQYYQVFRERGGFDLVLGNPPWVQPDWQFSRVSGKDQDLWPEITANAGMKAFLSASYRLLAGHRRNLYKCFIARGWELAASDGLIGYLHPESIYEDPRGGLFRRELYPRLVKHYQFINELTPFAEIHHSTKFSINVYQATPKESVGFSHIANLFKPQTILECLGEAAVGRVVPGIKEEGSWNTTGHPKRLLHLDNKSLALFADVFSDRSAALETRLPAIHCQESYRVLERFSRRRKLKDLPYPVYSGQMLNETIAVRQGIIQRASYQPQTASQWIMSGPHVFIGNPIYKTPNENCKNNLDYSLVDLLSVPADYLPRANYQISCGKQEYRQRVGVVQGRPIDDYYRLAFRAMIGPNSERSLIGAIIPPGVGHINGLLTFWLANQRDLLLFAGLCASIVYDFVVKVAGKSNLHDLPFMLPIDATEDIADIIISRYLRLNCLTRDFRDLWEGQYLNNFSQEQWTREDDRLSPWSQLTQEFRPEYALRNDFERRQALVEIDALAALAIGLSLEELLTIYRVQFPVLQQYEAKNYYDKRGSLVPTGVLSAYASNNQRICFYDKRIHPHKERAYFPPFTLEKREKDLARAYQLLKERVKSSAI